MAPITPKLIRRIGFGYALDFMPTNLIVGFNQLRKKLQQAQFRVMVLLVPLIDVPPDLDMLIVPKELEETACAAIPGLLPIVLDDFPNHPFYTELVKQLEQGTEIYALRGEEERTESGGIIEHYRGYDRID